MVFSLFQKSLAFLLPHRCFHCKDIVPNPHSLCGKCWSNLTFITNPTCSRCGFPFEFTPSSSVCGSCASTPPLFEKGYSALIYNDISKNLLLRFKHGDALYLTPFLGNLFLPLLSTIQIPQKNLLLVPIPLHPLRLFKRQYNQAALLAQYIHKKTNITYASTVLKRHRHTSPQGHLSFSQRKKNVRNAFSIDSRYCSALKGKTCLLIDDVWTTGTTLSEATKTLLNAGSSSVFVFTVARVFK